MATIQINQGIYRIHGINTEMKGYKFELVESFRVNARGGYITVDGGTIEPRLAGVPERNIRIWVNSKESYTVVEGVEEVAKEKPGCISFEQVHVSDDAVAHESDDEIIERLRYRFHVLTEMTKAVKFGQVRALIVTGPPGVGKSFGIEEVLHKEDLFNMISGRKPKYEIVKGAVSALGLYAKLYEYSSENSILVFDDLDSIFGDELSLNILKAALDSSKRRMIHWNTDSRFLNKEDIPSSFEFKGGVIFVTNLKFEHVRSKKLQDHLAALESRCHFIDLQMDTEREKLLRIKQIVRDGMLDTYNFTQEEKDEVIEFVESNKKRMREISLRTVIKCSDLKKSFPSNWQSIAKVTLMRNAA